MAVVEGNKCAQTSLGKLITVNTRKLEVCGKMVLILKTEEQCLRSIFSLRIAHYVLVSVCIDGPALQGITQKVLY